MFPTLQATVPSWAPSDAPFVWDTTATSVTLGWPEPASNGDNVTGYEVRAVSGCAAGWRCSGWMAVAWQTASHDFNAATSCLTHLAPALRHVTPPLRNLQVEMDDGSGFRHVARAEERQCTVGGLRSGILYK